MRDPEHHSGKPDAPTEHAIGAAPEAPAAQSADAVRGFKVSANGTALGLGRPAAQDQEQGLAPRTSREAPSDSAIAGLVRGLAANATSIPAAVAPIEIRETLVVQHEVPVDHRSVLRARTDSGPRVSWASGLLVMLAGALIAIAILMVVRSQRQPERMTDAPLAATSPTPSTHSDPPQTVTSTVSAISEAPSLSASSNVTAAASAPSAVPAARRPGAAITKPRLEASSAPSASPVPTAKPRPADDIDAVYQEEMGHPSPHR